MITAEERDKSNRKRIEILREGNGSNDPEVIAWDAAHPTKAETPTVAEGSEVDAAADGTIAERLTTEEVAVATETVPAAGKRSKSE